MACIDGASCLGGGAHALRSGGQRALHSRATGANANTNSNTNSNTNVNAQADPATGGVAAVR
jgi:hypothetical protein